MGYSSINPHEICNITDTQLLILVFESVIDFKDNHAYLIWSISLHLLEMNLFSIMRHAGPAFCRKLA